MPSRAQSARPVGHRALPALLGLLAALCLFAGSAEAQTTQQWRRWEKVLTSLLDYSAGNPYRDLTLTVTYKLKGTGRSFSRYGFWDGGSTFKIRGAFPPGTWDWSTTCSGSTAGKDCADDTNLKTSGSVTVVPFTTPPPPCTGPGACYSPYELYNRGFPAVSADGRYLTYFGGATPFFWAADTAWMAPALASTTAWQTYLTDRLSKGFTAVLLALAPDTDWADPVAFMNYPAGCASTAPVPNPCSIPLKSYWQAFEAKVQQANQAGLLVLVVGLNDPMDQGGPNTRAQFFPAKSEVERFSRYLGARLAGNFVVYSGSFDDGKGTENLVTHEVQEVVMKAALAALYPIQPTPFYPHTRQLKSIHLGGGADYADYAAFQNVVDVQLFHSGHGSNNRLPGESRQVCALRRAREMPLALGNYSQGAPPAFSTPRPVGNVETLYESDNEDTGNDCIIGSNNNATCGPQEPDTPNRVRQAGHLTSLSGAFGSTTGSGHVKGPVWTTTEGVYPWVFPTASDFTSYLSSPATGYMKNLRALFATRPWKDLLPKHCVPPTPTCQNLIVSNDNVPGDQKAVIAVTPNWKFAITYMPNNDSLILETRRFAGFPTRWTKTWWNPRTGRALSAARPTCIGTQCTFTRPLPVPCPLAAGAAGECDWALILEETCPACAGLASSTPASSILGIGAGQADGEAQSGIAVQLESADGSSQEPASQVSTDPTVLHKLARIVRGRSGRHLVVWQSENLDGSLWGIFARRLDSNGLPLEEPFQVNTEVENDQTDPAVTQSADQFVVTWTSIGQDGDLGGIFAQRIQADGAPDGPEFRVNTTNAGHQGYSQVAASTSGDFVVAWESGETGSRSETIYATRFDKLGNQLGDEIRIDSPVDTFSALVTLTVTPLGTWSVETQRYDASGADLGRFLRRFSIAGQPVGAEVEVFPPAP